MRDGQTIGTPPPPFDRSDALTGIAAALVSFAVYAWTTAPSVTLLDSGEFLTAAQHFGVPHPTGYPLWTMLAWAFHLLPLGNAAWEINLLSGILGALAVGLAAGLCRNSLRWLFPVEAGMIRGLATSAALSAALLFAFSLSMWSQAVIAEIYTLHALLTGLFLLAIYAWIRRPDSLPRLLAVFFALSLAFGNHQLSLALSPLPFAAVLMVRRRMIWDLLVAALLTAELFYLFLAILSGDALVLKSAVRLFYCILLLTAAYLALRGDKANWSLIALLPVAVAAGLLPYAYMPLASSTNPPMNWGYAREAKGFFYSFNRSQYSGSLTSQSLRAVGPLVGVSPQVAQPPAPANPPPGAESSALRQAGKWTAFLLGRAARDFTPLSWLALVLAAAAAAGARDDQRRSWMIILLLGLLLAALLQPLIDGATADANGWWLQMPYHTYTNLVIGLLCGIGFCMGAGLLIRRAPYLGRCVPVLLLLPAVPLLANYSTASQRNNWLGWQYGYDILQSLPKGSILIGGTDPGRFVPTYLIFGESLEQPEHKRDRQFDRRDLYIITQNALGDPFYMKYLRDHYTLFRPPVKNRFERWLGRDRMYPETPLVLPSQRDMDQAVIAAAKPDPITGKRLEKNSGILAFSAVLHWIWKMNRGAHEFFVEESFPIEWTYDYAIPHGLVYKLADTRLESIPAADVERDLSFWHDYKSRLLANPDFLRDFDARRSFSKLRATGGNIYRYRGMLPEAERAYQEALELWPCEGSSLYWLTRLHWERGEFDGILKFYDAAVQSDPLADSWRNLRDFAVRRKSLQAEIEAASQEQRNNPENPEATIRLAGLFANAGEQEKAITCLEAGLERFRKDPAFLRFVSDFLLRNGRPAQALDPATNLVGIQPELPENHLLLARVLLLNTNTAGFYGAAAKAVDLGGRQVQSRILEDPVLRPLHDQEEFKILTGLKPAAGPARAAR